MNFLHRFPFSLFLSLAFDIFLLCFSSFSFRLSLSSSSSLTFLFPSSVSILFLFFFFLFRFSFFCFRFCLFPLFFLFVKFPFLFPCFRFLLLFLYLFLFLFSFSFLPLKGCLFTTWWKMPLCMQNWPNCTASVRVKLRCFTIQSTAADPFNKKNIRNQSIGYLSRGREKEPIGYYVPTKQSGYLRRWYFLSAIERPSLVSRNLATICWRVSWFS